MLVLTCFVLLVVLVPWWLSGFQFWGFHSGSAIWCCLFLAGNVPKLSLYGTSAVVRPCTAVDCVVSLLKAYIYGSTLATPLKKWLLRLTSLHPTLPFVEHIVQWRTEPCLRVHWCHEGHVFQHWSLSTHKMQVHICWIMLRAGKKCKYYT